MTNPPNDESAIEKFWLAAADIRRCLNGTNGYGAITPDGRGKVGSVREIVAALHDELAEFLRAR